MKSVSFLGSGRHIGIKLWSWCWNLSPVLGKWTIPHKGIKGLVLLMECCSIIACTQDCQTGLA